MTEYCPIDCEFHDILEHNAVLKNFVDLLVRTEEGEMSVTGIIESMRTDNGEEYLSLSGLPEPIRLDQIVSCEVVPVTSHSES